MVKKQRTSRAEAADVGILSQKASEYKQAMEMAYSQGLWDPAVSNGVHALLLMANAVTAQVKREYYTGQDHDGAAGYLLAVTGPEARNAVNQMQRVVIMKTTAEYDRRSYSARDAEDAVKRVRRFFEWAEGRIPQGAGL
ncbi:MAG: HEPN domain-containing protein [Actinomycetota bacterium]